MDALGDRMKVYGAEGYRRRAIEDQARVVVLMSREEVVVIDAWAIPAGHSSRSAAIRLLLKKGLEALQRDPILSEGGAVVALPSAGGVQETAG